MNMHEEGTRRRRERHRKKSIESQRDYFQSKPSEGSITRLPDWDVAQLTNATRNWARPIFEKESQVDRGLENLYKLLLHEWETYTQSRNCCFVFFCGAVSRKQEKNWKKATNSKLLRHVSTLIFGCSILLATLMYDWQLILVFLSCLAAFNFLNDRYSARAFVEPGSCWLVLALHLDRFQFGLMSRDRQQVKFYRFQMKALSFSRFSFFFVFAAINNCFQFSFSAEMFNQIIRRRPPSVSALSPSSSDSASCVDDSPK